MATYRRKATTVDAFHYTGQAFDSLPDFIKNYKAYSPNMGEAKVGRDITARLLIPHEGGIHAVQPGNWLFLDGNVLSFASEKKFNEAFGLVDDDKPVQNSDIIAPLPVTSPPQPVVTDIVAPAPVIEEAAPAEIVEQPRHDPFYEIPEKTLGFGESASE